MLDLQPISVFPKGSWIDNKNQLESKSVGKQAKIYHIVHVDRLPSIIADGRLWSDAEMVRRPSADTTIGINKIKQRRLKLPLDSHSGLHVGDCVPFYFCPRSVMLYLLHMGNNPDLKYRDGQSAIIHLEADLHRTVKWAEKKKLRWAFTLSNAGSFFFEDRCKLTQLDQIDWNVVQAKYWQDCKDRKQAEFLIERKFPWKLISRIGVHSKPIYCQVVNTLSGAKHQPLVEILPEWYY